MNPYWGVDFFEFFGVLIQRLCSGSFFSPQADEVQMGVLVAISLSCGLIGPFLVLKRMAMFANSLSHTILLGIICSFLFASAFWGGKMFDSGTLLLGAFAASCFTAVLTEGAIRLFRLSEDASIGIVFSTLFACGILLATIFTRNVHLGTEAVMGNADALQLSDVRFALCLACANLGVVFLFYRQLQISCFDRCYAATIGIHSGFFHFLLLLLSAAVCVAAFRAVGVFLVLAFLTGPYLIARLFYKRLLVLLIVSPALGAFASVVGVALSRHFLSVYGLPLSTGGVVVCVIGFMYFAAIFTKSLVHGIVRKVNPKNECIACAKKESRS